MLGIFGLSQLIDENHLNLPISNEYLNLMNEITLPKQALLDMLTEAAELGAMNALKGAGLLRPYLSKQEAFRMYGRALVERWLKEGLIVLEKDGGHSSKCRIDRVKIEAVAKVSNRHTYSLIRIVKQD